MQPISNRSPGDADASRHSGRAEKQPGSPDDGAAKDKKATNEMKLINRALDLSPDASEEAALGGIDKLKKTIADAGATLANRETEIAALKADLANRDAAIVEADLDAAGITDAEPRARWKAALLANRESGKALLGDFVAQRKAAVEAEQKAKEAGGKPPLTNRSTAKTPEQGGDKKELTGIARAQAALEAERAHNQEAK
jgi:hypothetical protein